MSANSDYAAAESCHPFSELGSDISRTYYKSRRTEYSHYASLITPDVFLSIAFIPVQLLGESENRSEHMLRNRHTVSACRIAEYRIFMQDSGQTICVRTCQIQLEKLQSG